MKVLFVANGGGHLHELLHLSERLPFPVDQSVWVTFDSPQSRSMLRGRDVRYVRYSSPRDGKATAANLVAAARILTGESFDVAISTGATVAVSFLPLARLLGVNCYYIESATRTDGPSLTGRLLERVPGIHLYTQHPGWADSRWSFAGSVFDRFASRDRDEPPPIRRAVVTVGASETYGFDRLVRRLVTLLPADAEVLWQTGASRVDDLGIDAHTLIPARELEEAMGSADVVVTHAGVGSALSALEAGRMPILVPREAGHGEHVDDHQLQIAAELEGRNLAVSRKVDQLDDQALALAARSRIEKVDHPEPLAIEVPRPRDRSRRRQPAVVRARAAWTDGAGRAGRPVFVSWGAIAGRSMELADALDADVLTCFPPDSGRRPSAPVRYLVSTGRTIRYLTRMRPRAVVVTNPPIIPALIAIAYGRLTRRPVVVDDHPGAFGAQGYRIGQLMLPIHRRLAPMAELCLVTDQTWVVVVEEWGGTGLVLHEAPGDWTPSPPRVPGTRPVVLFVCTFARDEPVVEVIDAAASMPEVDFAVTGLLSKKPPMDRSPANVTFVGFLDPAAYREAIDTADVVLALTTEPTSAMRAAFEAVWAEKVLVVNDWDLLKSLFPNAVHVENSAESIAGGLREALEHHGTLRGMTVEARRLQSARWEEQLAALREAIADPSRAT